MYSHYNLKDIYNNIQKEDEESESYKSIKCELEKLEINTLTNILVVKSKLEDWTDIINFSEKALKKDPENVKALFFRGKALGNLHEYDQAIDTLKKVIELDEDNAEAKKEIAKVKKEKKEFLEKEKQMFKFV
jgi:tetratricopeptide (TPR) repeat protein